MRKIAMAAAAVLVVGCAGHVDYRMPAIQPTVQPKSVVLNQSREEAWQRAVPGLSKRFFVINNMDKASGFINLSYAGDPEKYVDCGQVTSDVKNLSGDRHYSFPGARAQQVYETMEVGGVGLSRINRRMSLEGRINLTFEEVDAKSTRVTASVRYVLTRDMTIFNVGSQRSGALKDTISFNSAEVVSFNKNAAGWATTCLPTGALEREILAAISE